MRVLGKPLQGAGEALEKTLAPRKTGVNVRLTFILISINVRLAIRRRKERPPTSLPPFPQIDGHLRNERGYSVRPAQRPSCPVEVDPSSIDMRWDLPAFEI